jgi:hypothetical protein
MLCIVLLWCVYIYIYETLLLTCTKSTVKYNGITVILFSVDGGAVLFNSFVLRTSIPPPTNSGLLSTYMF